MSSEANPTHSNPQASTTAKTTVPAWLVRANDDAEYQKKVWEELQGRERCRYESRLVSVGERNVQYVVSLGKFFQHFPISTTNHSHQLEQLQL